MSQMYEPETENVDMYYHEAKQQLIEEHLANFPEDVNWKPNPDAVYGRCYDIWCDRASLA
jgi:hypothetical protein